MFRPSPVAPTVTRRAPAVPSSGTVRQPIPAPETVVAEAPSRPPSELGPIIKAKIQPPALRSSTLSRGRLNEQLRESVARRLTLLVAEAGYGKTTLLGDFALSTDLRVVWYRLDPTDGGIVDWVSYLVAAFREVEPSFGQATVDLLGEIPTGGPPKSAFLASLISELGGLEPRPTVLILDDFQAVDENEEAADLVGRLTRDAPPWLTLVLSTRRRPDIELGRLAAAGELAEVSTDDLRFTREETAELFAATFSMSLDDDVLETLDSRTRGWVASLQLFYGSIRGRARTDVRSFARALSGATSPVYDFLAEEVLDNIAPEIENLLVRASLLENVEPREVVALLADSDEPPSEEAVRGWMEQADRLGLFNFSSPSSETRQIHPLLREFLLKELRRSESEDAIRQMHLRVAEAVAGHDPLTAAHHYAEAGDERRAMDSLDSSVVLTIGSGRWGMASQLISRLEGTPAGPAVAAIRARQLMEDGELEAAAALLDAIDVSSAAPDVRAQFRHTMFSLGWRTGDRERMYRALHEITDDADTPSVLRDIAELLLEASSDSEGPRDLRAIAKRLQRMSIGMADKRLTFYSAIALHDSGVAFLNAGEFQRSLECLSQALDRFHHLTFFAVEQLSTHTVMAVCEQELGNELESEVHQRAALSTGRELADVPGELATLTAIRGNPEEASELLRRARSLQQRNQSDAAGDGLVECALGVLELRTDVSAAITRLSSTTFDGPLEFGYSLQRDALLAQALLLDGRDYEAQVLIARALVDSRTQRAGRAEARLAVLSAIAARDISRLRAAVVAAELCGAMALLELSDVLLSRLELLTPLPEPIAQSIESHPKRWLPAIRKLLEDGNTPQARAAAALLDRFGSVEDVGLLRAYAKTYVRKGPAKTLGRALARRTSPALIVHDLGQTRLSIGAREVKTAAIRRKSASVLMYLLTRQGFAANREQVIDELWPETDPVSASNNLNQSLYFLRREIDPWYEDDLSVDYVELQGDLVWLDRELVRADSEAFVTAVNRKPQTSVDLAALVLSYEGRFAPEFEYEEWAMSWRDRTHATFLDAAHSVIDDLIALGDFRLARDVAAHTVRVDPEAADVELRLVWLYGRLGMLAAARSQYDHYQRRERLDGSEPIPLPELLRQPTPDWL